MKRINQFKKLFKIEGEIILKDLKTTYRTLVKEWHPDKFVDPVEKEEAEALSVKIIEGYHFLVSIAPETKEANLEEYTKTITLSKVEDFKHKSMLLEITFTDGNTYEYFGVNENLFHKFVNAEKRHVFGRKRIYTTFLYRKSKKAVEAE